MQGARDCVRAFFFVSLYQMEEMTDEWKQRLVKAVEKDGRSYRELSKLSGNGPNFVSELVRDGKDPGVERIIRLARVLGISLSYLFTGLELTGRDEEFARLVASLPVESKQAVLQLLRDRQAP